MGAVFFGPPASLHQPSSILPCRPLSHFTRERRLKRRAEAQAKQDDITETKEREQPPSTPIHLTSTATLSNKPWLKSKRRSRADQKVHWTFCAIFLICGFGSIVALFVTAILGLPMKHKYCLILDEQFQGTEIDPNVWTHEQQTGGWGTGEFEWTTDSKNNSFVKDGKLYIVPTLTSDTVGEVAVIDGYTLNLTSSNLCTSPNKSDHYCAVRSDIISQTILPPVQSARLTTKISRKAIKFGKVEVTAKMPAGDWIWPAIWMMPLEEKYGPWPASGEIDLFESKGNPSLTRSDQLSSAILSTLHWGPLPSFDMYRLSQASINLRRNFLTKKKRTIGMEWDENGIRTWQSSRAHEVLKYKFKSPFWQSGQFPALLNNGTILTNPWTTEAGVNVPNAAPFDQDFFLILSVAVGSTNGYFDNADAPGGKPWSDLSKNPVREFWTSRSQWLPTWPTKIEDRAMVVDSVKIWQQC